VCPTWFSRPCYSSRRFRFDAKQSGQILSAHDGAIDAKGASAVAQHDANIRDTDIETISTSSHTLDKKSFIKWMSAAKCLSPPRLRMVASPSGWEQRQTLASLHQQETLLF
jgi:hypothetical protein